MPSYNGDQPSGPDPDFIISPSTVGAAVKTIGSLLAFAVMFFTAMVGFARDLDLNGALIFLQRDDVVKSMSAVLTLVYLIWRAAVARRKKQREVVLVNNVPDDVAMLSTDLAAAAVAADPPPSRARETTTPPGTRLVSMSELPSFAPPPAPVFADPKADGGFVTSLAQRDPFTGTTHHTIVDVQPVAPDFMTPPALFEPADADLDAVRAQDPPRALFTAPAPAKPVLTGYATWLADVLRAAGCQVVEVPGWQSRGHGPMGMIRGVLAHHTASQPGRPAPSVGIVTNGRPDLAGPLAHLVLGRDGVFHVIAAGRCYHAGAGVWRGVTDGNRAFIGIEAENVGTGAEPWPDVEMDAYARGTAAILRHLAADATWCVGHKEYALPKGRKIDPAFDMDSFRDLVGAQMVSMGGLTPPVMPGQILVPAANPARAMLQRGDKGESVVVLQQALGMTGRDVDGDFGPATHARVVTFQKAHGLVADGKVGPKTWAKLPTKQ